PAVGIVLAVFEADLGAMTAVAAHDEEVIADAGPGEVRLAVPEELAVVGRDAKKALEVQEQPLVVEGGIPGAEDLTGAPGYLSGAGVDGHRLSFFRFLFLELPEVGAGREVHHGPISAAGDGARAIARHIQFHVPGRL